MSRPSPPARVLMAAVQAYRLARSGGLPTCRYIPSCSAYALEALEQHGAARGTWLTARRLARCHPWAGFGYDPVPEPGRSLPASATAVPPAPSPRARPTA
jgi:putative membrane protein insertion efficiency factor